MRKMKLSIKTALASTLVITSTAAIAYATPKIIESKSAERENKLKLAVEKVDGDTVKIALDNVQEIPKSLQFSIQLQGATLKDGTSSIRDLIKQESEERLKNNAYSTNSNDVLVDYTYNENDNTIDVLITSENAIPKISNEIEILELDVKPESANDLAKNELPTYKIVPSDNYEYKYVTNTNREYISKTVDYDNESISLNMSPTIKAGDTYIELEKGEKLELTAENLGITMEDPEGKEVTLEVKKDGVEIKEFVSDTAGVYNLSCTAIDNYGDRSETITVQIYIAEDEDDKEEVSLIINATDKVIKVGDKFDPLEGVTVTDSEGNEVKDVNIDVKIEGKGSDTGENKVDTSKAGEYKVTYSVTSKNGEKFEKQITVIVKENITLAESITINNKLNKLYLGAIKTLSATINKEADIKDIEWSTSDENIAEIEVIGRDAKVIAKAEGQVTITASTIDGSNKSDSLTIDIRSFDNNDDIPSFIVDIVDKDIVTPLYGIGDVNDPLVLEVKNTTVENFNKFIKDLEKLKTTLEDKYEDGNSTVYKIKIEKKINLFKFFKESNAGYIEIRIDSSLDNYESFKEQLDLLLDTSENPGDGNNPEDGNNPGDGNSSGDGENSETGNNSGNGENSGEENKTEIEDSNNKDNVGKLPITGQESIIGFISIAALGTGAFLLRKKKNKKQ